MVEIREVERYADILDQASQATALTEAKAVADASWEARPQQDGSITECVICDTELGERAQAPLFKVRCIRCQELYEKKRGGYAMG